MAEKVTVEISGKTTTEIAKQLRDVAAEVEKLKLEPNQKHIELSTRPQLWKISYET